MAFERHAYPPPVRFRAFPVSVVVDGALVEPALLWATDDHVEVWAAGETRDAPRLVASYPGALAKVRAAGQWVGTEDNRRRALFAVELADGSRLLAGKSVPCGCGNPLKSWVPPARQDA